MLLIYHWSGFTVVGMSLANFDAVAALNYFDIFDASDYIPSFTDFNI